MRCRRGRPAGGVAIVAVVLGVTGAAVAAEAGQGGAQSEVTRVAETLLDSPFLIAQDLLSLDAFTVQRLGWGISLTRRRDRLGLTFAVENLANTYYREHFQFAPSRGRTFTVGVSAGAF